MNGTHADPARIVFDPAAIPPRELRVLRAADRIRAAVTAPLRRLPHAADRIAAVYLLAATGAAAARLALPGAPWAWAWLLAATALLAAATAAAARRVAHRYRGRYVNPARMDTASRQLLAQTQAAADGILATRICRDGYLDALATAAALSAREWEIASMLAETCSLAATRAGMLDGTPGGPDPDPQQETLRQARAAALWRAADIEDYARQVKAADAAYRAHAAASPLATLDSRFLDLAATAAAGHHARGEVHRLHTEAATAEQALTA